MSAFEVKVTPTRCKNKRLAESREPTEVVMAPFSGKSIVLFEGVPVTKTAKRILRIINPSEADIEVSVCKPINPDHNISLEWTENSVPAQNEITMEMIWSPLVDVSCKETLQLIDDRNFRKDVMIILKSLPNKPVKNVRKFPTISSSNNTHVKTLRLKSPTSAANKHSSRLTQQQLQQQAQKKRLAATAFEQNNKSQGGVVVAVANKASETKPPLPSQLASQSKASNHNKKTTSAVNKLAAPMPTLRDNASTMKAYMQTHTSPLTERNIYANENDHVVVVAANLSPHILVENQQLKENVSPLALSNVLDMIDELKFTPATVTLSRAPQSRLENLALLPTPMAALATPIASLPLAVTPDQTDNVRELKPRCLTTELYAEEEQAASNEDIHNDTKGVSIVITNKTFEVKHCESLEISGEQLNCSSGTDSSRPNSALGLPLNKTTVISTTPVARPLEIIREEDNTSPTQAILTPTDERLESPKAGTEEDLKRDIKLVGTPLRKYSESMKDLYQKSPQAAVLTQGSLPNLNEMESIKSFEQNRYFQQATSQVKLSSSRSTTGHGATCSVTIKTEGGDANESADLLNASQASLISHPDVMFNHNEILAQSSRFNLNEVGLKYRKCSPVVNKTKNTNSKNQTTTTPPSRMGKTKLNTVIESSHGHKRRSAELSFSDSQSVDSIVSSCSTKTNSTKSSYSAVSPPKRQRLDLRSPSCANGATSKVKSWGQTQPKKFKMAKTLSLVKKPLTPRKAKEEPRTRLYDSELFLQPYINPDPFAATTTCDPFLASTMYLDEAAVDRHQTDFKKWLNALVTMPADLDTDSNAKIDVGKLFNEVRHKDLILAPTKEEQSMNYLTNFRLESLRKAAVQLFLSEEMRGPCSKVAVYVQKNAMRIRSDRNLHLDVVTQREILELLLCFNPLWLRLGLEVVYGEKIHLQSNRDIVGLSTFILNRFFRDKFLEQKYSKAYTLSEEYADHIKKFTLQKFFFLMLFLDKAKEKRIITHNPCLFIKKSPHKETREILLRFSCELLANVGDITRDLKRLGYVLTHKQNYLDEFDYAFHNLAVDLRDGIRLTRVMEIILLRDDLTKQLRVPAISRLQRVFNVNLAIKALGEADFQLKGEITANDIVDGHREKTLSLLWQIIYKFRSPKFHAAAKVIQQWWRNSWLRVVVGRRIRRKEELKREAAATTIQKVYRGFRTRRQVAAFKKRITQAVVVLQKHTRRYLARRKYLAVVQRVMQIQKWLRTVRLGREERQRYKKIREATVSLQRHWRSRQEARALRQQAALEKCKYHQERKQAACRIQALWRGYQARRVFSQTISAVLACQRLYRARKLMLQDASNYQQLRQATILVQKRFRAKREMQSQRDAYQRLRASCVLVQSHYRANVLMRQQRAEYLSIRQKIVFIQQKWRATLLSRRTRVHFISVQYYTTVLQQKFRARKQMRIDRQNYLHLRDCVINIQRRYRAKLLMRVEYRQYQAKVKAIAVIQSRFLAYKKMRYQRAKYQGTRAAVLCIQEHFRNFQQMKEDRSKYLTMKKAAVTIQQAYRLHCIMKAQQGNYQKLKQAVVCIQQRYRATLAMRLQRQLYMRQRSLIITIQQRYRAILLGRRVRQQYLHTRQLIMGLQRRFRARRQMQTQRQLYLQTKSQIIRIQTQFRGFLLMKRQRSHYQLQRTAAIKIQTWYRSILQMRQEQQGYQRIRCSSITIQQKWRATIQARNQRKLFLNTIQKIVYLQRVIRATLAMRATRLEYEKQRQAAIIIQQRYRAQREMLQIRSQYQLIRSLIICIQSKYRANLEMRRVRQDFLLLRRTTIHLQQKYRGRLLMREQREHFVQLRTTIVDFQAHARGALARRRFQALMTPEMKELIRQKKAAKIIQRFWRGYRIRKRLHNVRIKVIRQNIALLKDSTNAMNTIRFKVQDAVRILRGRFSASEALSVLVRLDRISRTVPHLLMCRSDFISTFCYGIMAQAIRSEVDKQLIMYCSRIILNLARYNSTTANTFQEGGLVTIAQMLLRWCDKDCEIFNTLCTLIWIFAHCPVKRKIIRDFMTTTDAIYMVRETKKLVARKEKMKQNVRKPAVAITQRSGSQQQQQPNFSSRALPSLEPDYGVIRNKPYTFISSVYAFDTILYKLGIDIF
ncbi:protein abnormal spindle [Stomoxys calcitrans]|uniref:protein abnormal spindle n=1 Tax=Stomoxys calcitrans TaxID=35570 RepID=UPI0027E2B97C|nr:protein abnormal spindle [Stomoxys calcitrans]